MSILRRQKKLSILLVVVSLLSTGCAGYHTTITPAPLTNGYYAIGSISSSLEDIKYQIGFNRQVADFLAQFNIYNQNLDSLYIIDSTLYSLNTTSILKNNFGNAEISEISLKVIFSVTPSNRNRQSRITLRKFTKTYESKGFYTIDANVVQTNTNSLDAFRRALEDILFDFRVDLLNHALYVEKSIREQEGLSNNSNPMPMLNNTDQEDSL